MMSTVGLKRNKNENDVSTKWGYEDSREVNKLAAFSTILVGICAFVLGAGLALSGLLPFWKSSIRDKVNDSEVESQVIRRTRKIENIDFNEFWEVWDLIKQNYVDPDKIDEKKLFEGSVKGMVDSVGDSATVYFTAEEYKQYKEQGSGEYEGIGVELGYNENGTIIAANVLKGSPAEEAGVRAGDMILKVDGQVTSNESIEKVVMMVRGKAGTEVTLTLLSKGESEPHDVKVTRGKIRVEAVKWEDKGDGVVIIEIYRFTDASFEKWKGSWNRVVSEVEKLDPKVIIVDLRGNGGGYFDAGIYAAEEFLTENQMITGQRERSGIQQSFYSQRTGAFADKNIVVLVDRYTASAAEIFAGALKDHDRAYIIGEKTTGKATFQQIFELRNGSAVKITIGRWVLPDGSVLTPESPVVPDKEVKYDKEAFKKGKDVQREAALEYARSL